MRSLGTLPATLTSVKLPPKNGNGQGSPSIATFPGPDCQAATAPLDSLLQTTAGRPPVCRHPVVTCQIQRLRPSHVGPLERTATQTHSPL